MNPASADEASSTATPRQRATIIPCIDLMDGKVVQLVQGREKALEGDAPEETLERFSAFSAIQVIDLDAAMNRGENNAIVEQLARKSGIRAGGGVRDASRAAELLSLGAERVIVGTSAFTDSGLNLPFLEELQQRVDYRRITIALDSRDGKIVVQGWQKTLDLSAEDVIHLLEPYCGGFLCTYVDKEGMMQGTDLEWFRKLREFTECEITAAGGITTLDEVRQLLDMDVNAALGMAIYTGRLQLADLATLLPEAASNTE
jgi:phosphoribosylformimino-5-aminoimidazole carboxamide ribotide isomerase